VISDSDGRWSGGVWLALSSCAFLSTNVFFGYYFEGDASTISAGVRRLMENSGLAGRKWSAASETSGTVESGVDRGDLAGSESGLRLAEVVAGSAWPDVEGC
jgi:hypothetical protein